MPGRRSRASLATFKFSFPLPIPLTQRSRRVAIGLLEIGRSWSTVAGTVYRALRDTVIGGDRVHPPQSMTAARGAGTAESVRLAGDGLRGAFDSFPTRMRPVYSTAL